MSELQTIRAALDESATRILRLTRFINERSVTRRLAERHLNMENVAWCDHLGPAYRALDRLAVQPTAEEVGQPVRGTGS